MHYVTSAGGKFIDGVKGAVVGMVAGSVAGGIKSAAIDGELTFSGAVEHIKLSFKENFSADSTVREGRVTMEEFNPDGDLYYASSSTSSVSLPWGAGASLGKGCWSSCQVKPGSGSIMHTSYGGVQRDGIYDMAAIGVSAPLAAASVLTVAPATVANAALGWSIYAVDNVYAGRGLTWQGSLLSASTGAFVGPLFGRLASASGGGLAGNYGWRAGQIAIEAPVSAIGNANGW